MTTRVVENEAQESELIALLKARKKPYTVYIEKGKRRSLEQNALLHLWVQEASEQLGDESPEDKRAYCKLHFGVPILRNENEIFREAYDRVVRPLPYEQKLAIMRVPLDMPVTRLMTTGQKKRCLDDIWHHFTDLGVRLTDPDSDEHRVPTPRARRSIA